MDDPWATYGLLCESHGRPMGQKHHVNGDPWANHGIFDEGMGDPRATGGQSMGDPRMAYG